MGLLDRINSCFDPTQRKAERIRSIVGGMFLKGDYEINLKLVEEEIKKQPSLSFSQFSDITKLVEEQFSQYARFRKVSQTQYNAAMIEIAKVLCNGKIKNVVGAADNLRWFAEKRLQELLLTLSESDRLKLKQVEINPENPLASFKSVGLDNFYQANAKEINKLVGEWIDSNLKYEVLTGTYRPGKEKTPGVLWNQTVKYVLTGLFCGIVGLGLADLATPAIAQTTNIPKQPAIARTTGAPVYAAPEPTPDLSRNQVEGIEYALKLSDDYVTQVRETEKTSFTATIQVSNEVMPTDDKKDTFYVIRTFTSEKTRVLEEVLIQNQAARNALPEQQGAEQSIEQRIIAGQPYTLKEIKIPPRKKVKHRKNESSIYLLRDPTTGRAVYITNVYSNVATFVGQNPAPALQDKAAQPKEKQKMPDLESRTAEAEQMPSLKKRITEEMGYAPIVYDSALADFISRYNSGDIIAANEKTNTYQAFGTIAEWVAEANRVGMTTRFNYRVAKQTGGAEYVAALYASGAKISDIQRLYTEEFRQTISPDSIRKIARDYNIPLRNTGKGKEKTAVNFQIQSQTEQLYRPAQERQGRGNKASADMKLAA